MRLLFVLPLFLALPLAAQIHFAAVNIGPNPDLLYYVDLQNPSAALPTPGYATLAGNFIRGVELESENSGWYVATSASSGSPTGFYRLEAGISTLVAPLPFLATAVGGLSFSAGEDFLYWSVDPPVGEDELWRIDFNGTFTLIGAITIPGVAAPVISGIATDPLTGFLYGIDTTIDSLIQIDTTSGSATIVGSLGVAISAVGGLDFSLDGTDRLFMASPTAVHEVNTTTGAALPTMGSLPGSTSSLAAIPSRTILYTPNVALGGATQISITAGPSNGTFGLFIASNSIHLPLPGLGVVRIDPFGPVFEELFTANFDPSGAFVLPVTIPNDPSFATFSILLQAYTLELGGGLGLTNATKFSVL